jgi:hypothetical protein
MAQNIELDASTKTLRAFSLIYKVITRTYLSKRQILEKNIFQNSTRFQRIQWLFGKDHQNALLYVEWLLLKMLATNLLGLPMGIFRDVLENVHYQNR